MTATGVFRVILDIDVVDGGADGFEQAWLGVAEVIGAQPANLGQWLLRDAEQPLRYLVVSDWTDEASFRRFEVSDPHTDNRRRLAPYRRGGSMTTMTIRHHHERHHYERDHYERDHQAHPSPPGPVGEPALAG